MAERDWYKQEVWTPEAEETFNSRIKRSRGQKISQFCTQASFLFAAGDHDNTLALCERGTAEVGDNDGMYALAMHRLVGAVRFARGDLAGAEQAFIAAAASHPPVEYQGTLRRTANFGTGVAPETCRARLLARQGKDPGDEWPEWARSRDCKPPLDQRPRPCVDLDRNPITDPEEAAEYLVVSHHVSDHLDEPGAMDAVFAAGHDGLRVIDEMVAHRVVPGFRLWHFGLRYLPWLGAYVGRVLVKQGGEWNMADEVAECTVTTESGPVDPYLVAWNAINLGVPLTTVLD